MTSTLEQRTTVTLDYGAVVTVTYRSGDEGRYVLVEMVNDGVTVEASIHDVAELGRLKMAVDTALARLDSEEC
ncbi:MAG: hypothetical protein AVDCRST_MAG70-139 [uncultured Thermomicrobiales bacterium]|uniref:Uncharacterized protein n=1 Tax=uncultured Thermomicrobiales bacterium TaxID=1645740 RepID=A0A6J4U648_9BACT|nr:MAG: hypothetical protein AVDCRST_MAG70-139 [uncultured Thermomicrobiales bacterium]